MTLSKTKSLLLKPQTKLYRRRAIYSQSLSIRILLPKSPLLKSLHKSQLLSLVMKSKNP